MYVFTEHTEKDLFYNLTLFVLVREPLVSVGGHSWANFICCGVIKKAFILVEVARTASITINK